MSIFYIIGVVVVVLFVLGYFRLRVQADYQLYVL
jgi:hypothetical protein